MNDEKDPTGTWLKTAAILVAILGTMAGVLNWLHETFVHQRDIDLYRLQELRESVRVLQELEGRRHE